MPRTRYKISHGDSNEDTAGNMPPLRRIIDEIDPQDLADTEGHGWRKPAPALSHDEDTEGNGFKFPNSDLSTEDTEGQRFRPPGAPIVRSDDTEGNGFRPPTLTGSDDDWANETSLRKPGS